MSESGLVRVAVAQYAVGSDLAVNLASALRVMDKAAENKPDLLVMPEFANHLSWYDDNAHCYEVSLDLDGDFLAAIATKAKEINAYVVFNVTLRRGIDKCTGTSLLYSPEGKLLGSNDKQVLIGHENDFLERATTEGPVIDTPIGKLGMYACMDGVVCETTRYLSLRGAQILCNSVNSFAPDEATLHVPVRAPENKVFIAAANKVGPLVPAELMDVLSEATNIPKQFLCGAGESQIVAPNGEVLAMASLDQEEVVFADINPSLALDKTRPDGTDIFASRRPDLYTPIAADPASQKEFAPTDCEQVKTAMVQLKNSGFEAIDEAVQLVRTAISDGAQLIVLPELFCFADVAKGSDEAYVRSQQAIAALASICGDSFVITSVVLNDEGHRRHSAVVIGANGVHTAQHQLHASNSYPWAALGHDIAIAELPFGRVGLATADDVIYPEMFRLLVINGAEIAAVPFSAKEQWELTTGLIERAAENRLNMLAVTQPSKLGASFGCALHKDFTMLTEWGSREFDGKLTYPIMTNANRDVGITYVELTPKWSTDKTVSRGTNLVRGRAWTLAAPLVAAN
jgi:predicted amidohydrolase